MQFNRESDFTSQDIKDFIDYFEGKIEVTSRNKSRYEKCINLEKAIEIYESDKNDIRKIYELTNIYKNSDTLRKSFTKFNKYKDDDFLKDYCDKIENMANYLEEKEEKGLINVAKELVENEDRFENYVYAKYFLNKYNKSSEIFTSDFLDEEGLTKGSFEYLKDIVSEYDPFAYRLYREKELANSRERRYRTRSNIRDMYNGITTGYTRSHTKFDELECYNLLPFRNVENLNELIDDFKAPNGSNVEIKFRKLLETIEPEKAPVIYKYLIEHKIITRPYNMTTLNDVRKENVIVNGKQVTEDEKDVIIRYLTVRRIPLFSKAVTLVRNKVLAGDITMDKEKNLRLTR
jgi:hypothetical protein